VKSFKNKSN